MNTRQLPPPTPPGLPGPGQDLPWINQTTTVLGIGITLIVAVWITTLGRLWVRCFLVKKPWWDDLFVVLAVSTFSMMAIVICVDMQYGMGEHGWNIPPQNIRNILQCQYVFGIAYASSTAAIKISLLLQYLRVFAEHRWTYRAAMMLLVLVALWGAVMTFISIFSCFPTPSAFWDGTNTGCYGFASPNVSELVAMVTSHSATNFAFDMLILGLAVRLQWVMEDAPSNRRSMVLLLLVGLAACGFALWRLVEVFTSHVGTGADPTFDQPRTLILSMAELYLAASCATIPFFWPVVRDRIINVFVTYEFKVESEPRRGHHRSYDQIELTPQRSMSVAGTGEGSGAVGMREERRGRQRDRSQASGASFDRVYFTEDDYAFAPSANAARKGTSSVRVTNV